MEKKIVCEKNDITLIEVPFWWDSKRSSLVAIIHAARPDISNEYLSKEDLTGEPIPIDYNDTIGNVM